MPPLLLAAILTLVCGLMARAFLRQRRAGAIRTRMGDVSKAQSARHFAALDLFNIVMLPVGGALLLLLWAGALSRTLS